MLSQIGKGKFTGVNTDLNVTSERDLPKNIDFGKCSFVYDLSQIGYTSNPVICSSSKAIGGTGGSNQIVIGAHASALLQVEESLVLKRIYCRVQYNDATADNGKKIYIAVEEFLPAGGNSIYHTEEWFDVVTARRFYTVTLPNLYLLHPHYLRVIVGREYLGGNFPANVTLWSGAQGFAVQPGKFYQ
jgi:hypothetical protein